MKKIRVLSMILAIVLLMTSVRMDWWERADALTAREYSAEIEESADLEAITPDVPAADADQSIADIDETQQGSDVDQETDTADADLTIEEATAEETTTDAQNNQQEEPSADIEKETEKAALTWQTLTVEAETAALQDEWNNATEPVTWMNDLWQWVFARDAEAETYADRKWKLFERNKLAPVTLTISGYLPEGVTAEARYIQFAESDIYSETALLDFDLTLFDAEGNPYIPTTDQPFTIRVDGKIINEAVEAGKTFVVYAQTEDTRKEEELPKDEFAASMLVYRASIDEEAFRSYQTIYAEDEKDNVLFSEVKYTDIEQQKSNEPLRFTEDDEKKGTLTTREDEQTKEQSVVFEAGTLPPRFVLSAQQAERSLAAKTEDGQTEVSVQGVLSEKMTVEAQTVEAAAEDTKKAAANETAEDTAKAAAEESAVESAIENLTGDSEDIALVGAWDIRLSHEEEGTCQPDAPVTVTITDDAIKTAMEEGADLAVWSISEEGEAVQVEDAQFHDSSVEFEAESLPVYMITKTVLEQNVLASDGKTYKVTVSYDENAGIPDGAELDVRELTEKEYEAYLEQTAEALGADPDVVNIAKAFDIRIVKDGEEYHQLNSDVDVSIQLTDTKVTDDMKVVHMTETPEDMGASADGDTLSFAVDGFSVFIIAKDELTRTYTFMNGSDVYSTQVLKDGENLVEPPAPTKTGTVFKYWSLTEKGDEPFTDFNSIEITETEQADIQDVTIHAVFDKDCIYVTYYDQYGAVVQREAVQKPLDGENAELVDTTNVSFTPVQDRDNAYVMFKYWTDKPRQTGQPQAGTDGVISVTGESKDIELYPVLCEGHWIYFDANKDVLDGGSADYTHPIFVENGSASADRVLAAVQDAGIPTSAGFTFKGWYMHRNNSENGHPVFLNEDGNFVLGLDAENKPYYNKLLDVDGNLANNPTIYAHWEPMTKSSYTVVIWTQKLSDDGKTASDEYSYQDSFTFEDVDTGSVISIDSNLSAFKSLNELAAYNTVFDKSLTEMQKEENPYYGFTYNSTNSDTNVTVKPDGSTIINIRYDRNVHTFTFVIQGYQQNNSGDYGKDNNNNYFRIYRRNSSNIYYYTYTNGGTYYYNGTLYTRSSSWGNYTYTPAATYNYLTTYYGAVDGKYYQLTIHNYSGSTYQFVSNTVKTITASYGCNIGSFFPIVGTNGTKYDGYSWTATDNSVYAYTLSTIETMPNADAAFIGGYTGDSRSIYYYVEAADDSEVVGDVREFNGKKYVQYGNPVKHGYSFITYDEEYHPIDGYTREAQNAEPYFGEEGFSAYNTEQEITDSMRAPIGGYTKNRTTDKDVNYLYYDRASYSIEFRDAFNNRDTLIENKTVKYKTSIQNSVAEVKDSSKFPSHSGYMFTGWYMDKGCTVRVFFTDPSEEEINSTKDKDGNPHYEVIEEMPSYNLQFYAGWEPVKYRITIDPAGGEMGGTTGAPNSYSSYFNARYGEYIAEYSNITRDYVKASAGVAGTHTYVQNSTDRSWLYEENGDNNEYIYKPGVYTLVGWFKVVGDQMETTPYNFANPVTEETTLRAKWRRTGGFKVEYSTGDGITAPVDQEEYVEGAHAVVFPPVAAPEGKTLDYWQDYKGNHYIPNMLVQLEEDIAQETADGSMVVTLTAVYRDLNPNERYMADYTFKVDNEIYYVQTIAAGEELVAPATPVKDGYTFTGWYYDSDCHRPFTGFGSIAAPVYTTLYAGFAQVFSVDYYLTDAATGNKTSTVLANQTYVEGEHLDTRHINHPVDLDHYVLRWTDGTAEDQSSSKGYLYNSMTDVEVTGNLTLYALLAEQKYLYFDSQGGSFVDPEKIPSHGWPVRPNEPAREGYIFQGWFTASEGGEAYDFDEVLPTGVETLYAHWTEDTVNPKQGTLTLLWWAQTADRPEDSAEDYDHYELVSGGTMSLNYGTYSLDAIDAWLAGNHFDIWSTDRLEGLYNEANPSEGRYEKSKLQNYFEPNKAKSDQSVTVDDKGNNVLNIRFDRKTYKYYFDLDKGNDSYSESDLSADKNLIHLGDKTYKKNEYYITIWLEKDVTKQWPIVSKARESSTDMAWVDWKTTTKQNYGWYNPVQKNMWITAVYFINSDMINLVAQQESGKITWQTGIRSETGTTATIHYYFDGVENVDYREEKAVLNKTKNPVYYVASDKITYYTLIAGRSFDGYEAITDINDKGEYNVKQNNTIRGTYVESKNGETKDETYWVYKYTYSDEKWRNTKFYNDVNRNHLLIGWPITGGSGPLTVTFGSDWSETQNNYTVTYNNGTIKNSGNVWYQENGTWKSMTYAQFISDVIKEEKEQRTRQVSVSGNHLYFYYKSKSYPLYLYNNDGSYYTGYSINYKTQVSGPAGVLAQISVPDYKGNNAESYEFDCWSTTKDSSAPYVGTMPAHALTLYAHFKVKEYTVTTQGVDGDSDGNDDTYTAQYGSRLKELNIPNPQKAGSLFQGWSYNGTAISGEFKITDHIEIEPIWQPISTHRIIYDVNSGNGTAPADDNRYIVGAKAVVKDGTALTISKMDIDGNTYTGSFSYWSTQADGTGERYYTSSTISIDEDDPETITLYANYSSRRETTLTYDKNADTAQFVTASGDPYSATEADGTILIKFKDDSVKEGNVGHPNTEITVGYDSGSTEFAPRRVGYKFLGWARTQDAAKAETVNGDRAYVNTLADGGNTLYAVWEKDTLPIKVYTYSDGKWQTGSTEIVSGSYQQMFAIQNDAAGWQPEVLAKSGLDYTTEPTTVDGIAAQQIKAGEQVCSPYSFAFGKVNGTTVKYIRYVQDDDGLGYHWEYCTQEGGSYTDIGDASLDVYYYEDPVSIPVYWFVENEGTLAQITDHTLYWEEELKTDKITISSWPAQITANQGGTNLVMRDPITLKSDYSQYVLGSFGVGPKNVTTDKTALSLDSAGCYVKNSAEGLIHSTDESFSDYTADSDIAVYVLYSRTLKNLFFDFNGGTNSDNAAYAQVEVENQFTTGETGKAFAPYERAYRNGYALIGWSTAKYEPLDENASAPTGGFIDINEEIMVTRSGSTYYASVGTETITLGTDYNSSPKLYAVWQKSNYVCKVTNADGELLYYKNAGSAASVDAVFSTVFEAFSAIANGKIYREDGTKYSGASNVEMLVENYTMTRRVYLKIPDVTLKTAAESPVDDKYPYTGATGTYATLIRGSSLNLELFYPLADSTFTLENITLDGGSRNVAVLGSLIYTLATTAAHPTVVNLKSGTTLQNGWTSAHHAGAVDVELFCTLNMYDGATIQNCKANDYGGAVFVHESGSVFNMYGGTIKNCSAKNGGAVGTYYHNAAYDNLKFSMSGGTIEDCSASVKGGAVFLDDWLIFNMSGGKITGCEAPNGSAVYVNNANNTHYTVFNMSGGTIAGNTASGSTAAAIEVGHQHTQLNFSGAPTVFGNKNNGMSADVLLNLNNTAIINTTGLSADAKIGVWPTYDANRDEGDPFGTTTAEGASDLLSGFVNDYYLDHVAAGAGKYLVGAPAAKDTAGNVIWQEVICKIIATDGTHVFPTIHDAVVYAETMPNKTARIEMLVDYAKPDTDDVTIAVNDRITLTTASKTAADGWSYLGTNDAAVIARNYSGGSMITSNGVFTVTDIVLDGNKDNGFTGSSDGGLIYANGTLNIQTGAVLRNSTIAGDGNLRGGAVLMNGGILKIDGDAKFLYNQAAHGGALHIGNGSVVTYIEGNVLFDHNTATGYGGGIYIRSRDTIVRGNVVISSNTAQTGDGGGINVGFGGDVQISDDVKILECSARNGGGINVENTERIYPCSATVSGNVMIAGCSASDKGGAVFVGSGDNTPSAFTMSGGTISKTTMTVNGVNTAISGNHSANGGAIDVGSNGDGSTNAKLYFSGDARVYDNFAYKNNAATTQQKNVVLDADSTDVINVTSAFTSSARIGVFVTETVVIPAGGDDPAVTQFDLHGTANTPFGNYTNAAADNTFTGFINDVNDLKGVSYESDGGGKLIYWQDTAAYIKLENRSSQNVYAKVTIHGGGYKQDLRKRGSDEQSAISVEPGKDYYMLTLQSSSSETIYLPAAATLGYTVELYQDAALTQRIDKLSDAGLALGEGAEPFDDANSSFSGALKAGPRYKIKVTETESGKSYYATTAKKYPGKDYTYDKKDSGNCYNEAVTKNQYTYIHIIDGGQQVAFMKVDGSGNAQSTLNGAEFTLYTDTACTTAAAGINPAAAKNGTAVVNGVEGTYDGIVLFDKVPAGIYYMKETTVPTGYSNTDKYVLIVGKDNMTKTALSGKVTFEETDTEKVQAALDAQNNAQTDAAKSAAEQEAAKKGYAIFKLNSDNKALIETDVVNYGLVNTSSADRKVILNKAGKNTASNTYEPLSGAKFEIYNYDMTRRADTEESGTNGVFWMGSLPVGTYYLRETAVPGGDAGPYKDNKDKYFKLEVTDDGTSISDTPMTTPDRGKHVVETAGSVSGGGIQ